MNEIEYFVSLQTSAVLTKEYNVMVNYEEYHRICDVMYEMSHKALSL